MADHVRIQCPQCRFFRDVPRQSMPAKPCRVTCPKCRTAFQFDPAAETPTPGPQPIVPPQPSLLESRSAPKVPPPPRRVHPPPFRQPSGPPSGGGIRKIDELLAAAWEVFQSRFATLFSIYLLMLVLCVAPPAIVAMAAPLAMSALGGNSAVVAIAGIIGFAASLAAFSWGFGALVVGSLDENAGVSDAFARSKEKLLPFAWVTFLVGFLITGGVMLLVIPGIIFTVWFFFAHFIVFDDDTRGMSALLKSRAYVSGRWFDVFLRLVVIWACSAVVGAIPVLGIILTLVAVPFVMVYQALLFQDIKEAAGQTVYGCSTGDKAKVIGVAAIGFIAVPAIMAGIFGAVFFKQFGAMKDLKITPTPSTGEIRVIPIPPLQDAAPAAPVEPPASTPSLAPPVTSPATGERKPEHIHIFIYAVNCRGTIRGNGEDLQVLEEKPDMQYNYNMGGEKLRHGRNTMTIDYTPLVDAGRSMKPKLKVRVSYWKESNKNVLGEYVIEDTSPVSKSFDFDIPEGS